MDLGSELRHARERLGLSLGDIAERTKIRAATLRAIENDDFDQLPPPIFTRGFLKSYAREVGLDPDAVAERFAALRAAEDAQRETVPASESAALDEPSPIDRATVETAVLIVAAGMLVVALNQWGAPAETSTRPNRADAPRAAATQGQSDRDATVATTGSPPVAATPPPPPRLMRIELLPQGRCWVEATADGTRVVYKLLNAGDRYALAGHEEVMLRVGDPAQFAFSINGAAGRSLGPAGHPVTVRITRTNAHEFIAAR